MTFWELCEYERDEEYFWVNVSSAWVTVLDCNPFVLIDEGTPGWFWPIVISGGVCVLGICGLGIYLLVKRITPWEEEAEAIRQREAEERQAKKDAEEAERAEREAKEAAEKEGDSDH